MASFKKNRVLAGLSIAFLIGRAGRGDRVNAFLGNYRLSRGIAAAGIVLCAMTVVASGAGAWRTMLLILGGTLVAVFRMHRFGKHYARELFVQYLDLSTAPPPPEK